MSAATLYFLNPTAYKLLLPLLGYEKPLKTPVGKNGETYAPAQGQRPICSALSPLEAKESQLLY